VLGDYPAVCLQEVVGPGDYSFPTTQLAPSSSDVTYAWLYARNKGMQVYADEMDLPLTPYGETAVAAQPMVLRDLLTAQLLQSGTWWACWGPVLEQFTLPTTPSLLYDQPNTMVAVADTDYYSEVGLYYVKTSPGTSADQCDIAYSTPPDRIHNIYDYRGTVIDMRGLGLQVPADMTARAQAIYEQVKGRLLLTGNLTLGANSGLKAANGGEFPPEAVHAGMMLQLTEVRDSLGFLLPEGESKFVIGKTEHSWSADGMSATFTPMGAVSRDLGSILQGSPPDSTSAVGGSA
jgi:hypothetical protein